MTRQGPTFPKILSHLQLSKTARAFLAETHNISTDFTELIIYSLGSLIQLHEGRDLDLATAVLPSLAMCYVNSVDTQEIIVTEGRKEGTNRERGSVILDPKQCGEPLTM